MENIFDRLQFIRCEEVFQNRNDAYDYVLNHQIRGDYPTITDPSKNIPTLFGEPMVLLYESDDPVKGPNLILAIGSVGVGTASNSNRTFFIDTKKTEEEIEELSDKVELALRNLSIITPESNTIKLSSEVQNGGNVISGDVKIADYRIVNNKANYNIIQTEGFKGIYAFVDMDYNPDTCVLTFNVNGVTEEFQLPKNQQVTNGWYDPKEESIILKMADGSQVRVLVTKLIEEWTVLPDGQTINTYNVSGTNVNYTPIILTRTHVGSKETEHEGIYEWQDVLEADVRVADHITDNILHKDRTGRYLYVKGTADNILYKDGQTVRDVLDGGCNKISTSAGNLIYKRPDGVYATGMLNYDSASNKLRYTYSDSDAGEIKTVEYQLNSVKLLEDITYDPVNEAIVIRYIDAQGEYQKVSIPVKDIIEEWDVNNVAHNINLVKYRSQGQGKDILSADANIHNGDNNILEDFNHKLYVNGVSSNIKYNSTDDITVKDAIDGISAATETIDNKVEQEISDRIGDVNRIDVTIGSGFSADPHETITYRFEQLTERVATEEERAQSEEQRIEEKLDAEIERSTAKDEEHDGRLDAIEEEIGDGFGPRNTVRDEIDRLQGEIGDVSAETSSRLTDVINEDHSINVETRNDENGQPTIKVINVNLSEEVEQGKQNIIKLNADGLYAGIDLSYEEAANKLIFTTTNSTKEIQLDSVSSIINMEYNPTKEAIEITYMTNGHEIKTIEIPVGDLIDEWRVEDGHPNAVKLEKVRMASGTSEQDVLKASVIITDDHDDNILVMDDGALYVSGAQIAANAAAISGLTDRMDAAEDDIRGLRNDLDDEIERSTEKDNELQSQINSVESGLTNEISRAQNAESQLANDILTEIERATLSEREIVNALSVETTRATTQEEYLLHLIEDEAERRASGDTINANAIAAEESRARETETRIETALNNEIERAQNRESELNTAIVNESLRANSAETQLYQSIVDETAARISADTSLQSQINQESSRAQIVETTISERLTAEIDRSTGEDQLLRDLITAETASRQEADYELEDALRKSLLTFDDTPSVDITKTSGNVVTADVKLQEGDNIIKLGQGLYASVHLSYDPATNKIKLITSNGEDEEIQLVGASLLEDLHYDPTNKALVITYRDATGEEHTVQFGVSELFNEWHVENPSEKSAVEMTKAPAVEPGGEDTLSARVLITDDRNGDGKPDAGSDNIVEIRNNGLYVDGSRIVHAEETSECVASELKSIEKAIFGNQLVGECGEGFEYEAPLGSIYINSATTINNATYILDQSIKNLSSYTENVENKVNIVSANTDCAIEELKVVENDILGMPLLNNCGEGDTYRPNEGTNYISAGTSFNHTDIILDREIKAANNRIETLNQYIESVDADVDCVSGSTISLYKLLYGENETLPECGEGIEYQPYQGCIISSARSFMEADELLNDKLCQILNMWESGETTTTKSIFVEDGTSKKLQVDAKLSHGNHNGMTDDDLTIRNIDGAYIDPLNTEFTDTNALRIVSMSSLPVDTPYNGIYLSNNWDCGLYYSEIVDAAAIAAAEAAGYTTTNYRTDESSTASNYNYMNNVRQSDI